MDRTMTYQDEKHYDCIITLESGQRFHIHADRISNNDHGHFQGWRCHAGSERISIDSDGNIWSGNCMNDLLGTVDDWQLLPSPTICRQKHCFGCTDDLMVQKYQTTSTSEP
jgi:hypothetical protein